MALVKFTRPGADRARSNTKFGMQARATPSPTLPRVFPKSSPDHARRTVRIRMTLPTTERLFWHCGDHTAKRCSSTTRSTFKLRLQPRVQRSGVRGARNFALRAKRTRREISHRRV